MRPVTTQQAKYQAIPPSGSGGGERIGNNVKESSPVSGALNTPDIAYSTALQPVDPVRPVAGYIGGKRNLSRRLVARIATIPHLTYAEGFVGMGGVFLRRTSRPSVEVINDWSEDVSTFFRVLQHHYLAFLDMMRFQVSSRAGFEKLLALEPSSLTDLQRSARFFYLQRTSFGGKVAGRGFGVSPVNASRFDMTKLAPMLEALHERLAAVTIERLHWRDFILRYDRPGTLFYLDPPYFGCENDYGKAMFDRAEFAEMSIILKGLKGRFLLSLNDHPEVRKTFADFTIEEVKTNYQVGANQTPKAARELIISDTR